MFKDADVQVNSTVAIKTSFCQKWAKERFGIIFMPVKDLGPNRLVVRLFNDRPRSAEAEKYLANRLNNLNSDGELMVLPDMGSSGIDSVYEDLLKLGLKGEDEEDPDMYFVGFANPSYIPWAHKITAKYLDGSEPFRSHLWIRKGSIGFEFNDRKFRIENENERIAHTNSWNTPCYTPATSEVVTQAFIEHCGLSYKMDHEGYHGFYHWMRVLQNGRLLAEAEKPKIKVVELFALLHDTQRQNENVDPEHGLRAAQFAKTLRGKWFDVTDTEMELLTEALVHHSEGYTEGNRTVRVCWDADRLDLGRVGIRPASDRLCTVTAKRADVISAAYSRSRS